MIKTESASVRELTAAKNLNLLRRLEVPENILVLDDGTRLQQIISNKFTPESGGINVKLAVIKSSYAEISITDTGIGICAEFIALCL